ncbi:hypothetical protein HPB52_006216 [Rhipicephalus sanguineus]|uniref:Uncharacterized protein n=1 Tax=Rhipicephalus sanguineus TaxID=34632 RepID=A0A9D4T8P3_RHISA|nr:hypothetical protein HPB52_006216 [Rhipicephalus sanguineus]
MRGVVSPSFRSSGRPPMLSNDGRRPDKSIGKRFPAKHVGKPLVPVRAGSPSACLSHLSRGGFTRPTRDGDVDGD